MSLIEQKLPCMPRSELLKYILDIESVVAGLEKITEMHARNYSKFPQFETFQAVRNLPGGPQSEIKAG